MGISKKSRAGLVAAAAAGALAIAALAGTAVANAADSPSSPASPSQVQPLNGTQDLPPQHAAEEELTGTTADSVKAAVEAKYPDATIDRMEKDADGQSVYEAHITKAEGTHVTVMLDESFAITGESAFGPGGKGGHGGPGMNRTPEEELTGATADSVKAAVEAKYPDATIDRMEKDADEGAAYEAHITKADGTHAKVMLDESFAITDELTGGPGGPGMNRTPEEALTGVTADSVKAAVEAKYPDATIDRMEKDSDGQSVYEAHITKADGTHVTVMLDESFAITGESAFGPGGKGGHGGRHGAPQSGAAAPSADATSSSTNAA